MQGKARAINLSAVILVAMTLVMVSFQHVSTPKINVKTNTIPSGSVVRVESNQSANGISTQTSSPYNGSVDLWTNGTQIMDRNGSVVILRGVNLSGYEYVHPIQWTHWESDYATIASWGFNVVRLPISWENLEPKPGYATIR